MAGKTQCFQSPKIIRAKIIRQNSRITKMGTISHRKIKIKTPQRTSRQSRRIHAQIINQNVQWLHQYRSKNQLRPKLQNLTHII